MLIRQGFQYALRLKAQREGVLRRWVGCRRFVFNEALAHQRAEVAAGRKRPGYAALCARLPELKKLHPWLCEPPAQSLQQALKDLCKAWDAYTSRFGSPRFKKKGEGDTLRLPQDCRYHATAGLVHLPKIGAVRLRHSREALGELKNVTLRQERGRWVASLQTEREVDIGTPGASAAVGLDFGAATTIMPSNDLLAPVELPPRIGRYERRMKRLQQVVSRKKRGSANRKKSGGQAQCLPQPHRGDAAGLPAPANDRAGAQSRAHRHRGPRGQVDDRLGGRHGRGARAQRQGQGRPEPDHPAQRLVDGPFDARVQGRMVGCDAGGCAACVHEPGV
jgi:putative transposase